MLLAEVSGRRVLPTGDGRGDHILDGLREARLLDAAGRLHLDVLTLPHHGSDRNVTANFFARVTAATCVCSANGKDGNPNEEVLLWIVDAARSSGRPVRLVVTNGTPSVQQLRRRRSPDRHGHTLEVLAPGHYSLPISLA